MYPPVTACRWPESPGVSRASNATERAQRHLAVTCCDVLLMFQSRPLYNERDSVHMSSIILCSITECDRHGVFCCMPRQKIPHAGHSTIKRSLRRALAVLDSVGLDKRPSWTIMQCHARSSPVLTYEAMSHCRVSQTRVLDCSAPCPIAPVVSSKHLSPLRLQAVCRLGEHSGVLDAKVLYKTP